MRRNNLSGQGQNAGFRSFNEETWAAALDETSLKTYQQPI